MAARRALAVPRVSLETADEVAQDVAEERPTASAQEMPRPARTTSRTHHRIKPGSVLAARAATEYVYVAQDMRRILLVAGGLIGLLFVLWLLLVVMKVVPLPFY